MPFRAVIFDLDGTLLDTIEDLTEAMNAALRTLGLPERTIAECKTFVGDGVATFVKRVLPLRAGDDPSLARRLLGLMRAEYAVRLAVKTRPYPGIPEILEALGERRIPAAVLSNKPHDSTRAVVRRFFPRRNFRLVLGAREGVPPKPDPAGAFEIARRLGLPPADFFYLGDTNTDMQTAVAAGMFPAGALWGFRTSGELLANGARALLERPAQVLDFFPAT
ncbi:MAG: HAD family hydrolase [Candidatus Aminicenantes bacterium]|nr:HAD family hydrolase [Candidatus Aminicenantes bacterium]